MSRKSKRRGSARQKENELAEQNAKTMAVIRLSVSDAGLVGAKVHAAKIRYVYQNKLTVTAVDWVPGPLFESDSVLGIGEYGPVTAGKSALVECVKWCLENGRHRFVIDTTLQNRTTEEWGRMAGRRGDAGDTVISGHYGRFYGGDYGDL